MDEAKIYNVCLQRVRFQISNAKKRMAGGQDASGTVILESYNTGDIAEIVDILEIYDLDDYTAGGLKGKLEDLAYTVSVLVRDRIFFDYDDKGHLGLFLAVEETVEAAFNESDAVLTAA
ncbi:MAG: hypothetical protein HZB33_12250 [Nitrospirae bacterium]|nr:hypothetical protein [Nitrospirota bacterium]